MTNGVDRFALQLASGFADRPVFTYFLTYLFVYTLTRSLIFYLLVCCPSKLLAYLLFSLFSFWDGDL